MQAMNALGKELKRLRKAKNLSQEEVAVQLHLKRQTYSHYETGRVQPSIKSLYALSSLYGVPMFELLKYMDVDLEEEKEFMMLSQEDELISYYRKLDKEEREDVLEFVKKRGSRVQQILE